MTYEVNNTIYIILQNAHLRLSNENLMIEHPEAPLRMVPLHHLQGIVVMGNVQLSSPLIAYCARNNIAVVWMDQYGRFQGRLEGCRSGNVLLRRAQHLALSDPDQTLSLARQFIAGKISNQIQVLSRHMRDYPQNSAPLEEAVTLLERYLEQVPETRTLDDLRGVEGGASRVYFGHFDLLIRMQREAFRFQGRNRRPPQDRTNALLSFLYTVYSQEYASALEAVGLDYQVGYLHALRPGRPALALDLMEEMRPAFIDRLVLRLINQNLIRPDQFDFSRPNAVYLNHEGRRVVLQIYQERKRETVHHPDAAEPIPWAIIPYLQARRLARVLRGEAPYYEPFVIR
ncbi:MAG: subtype I-C CRISPR-associated endonuclease Cas1 [Armatimonadetes bacterium JP3_11]|jgi:CRISPR-associated protein Cas1|nr:MAG: subtype I-C CRISPR-associated endonuclease Cas1 [Armatimonadetes bacterium CP1_7O]OYT74796.1 MAG: subtype I-C CRISPR-associated endonuclease Cas1 [Armatimonadetes bacterium JP3_11]RMH07756.1 MAG: type I-C CRISPR-associated endonuclease Cas1 [Armatimonadota bacterium]